MFESFESDERLALEEKLEASYRQIKELHDTATQSPDSVRGDIERSKVSGDHGQCPVVMCRVQEKYVHLCAKYQSAKTMISSLKQNSHLLAEQLISRDEQYNSYLAQLKEKFVQLESELVDTQRRAGLPVRLPYDKTVARNLLSPPEELKRQPVS